MSDKPKLWVERDVRGSAGCPHDLYLRTSDGLAEWVCVLNDDEAEVFETLLAGPDLSELRDAVDAFDGNASWVDPPGATRLDALNDLVSAARRLTHPETDSA